MKKNISFKFSNHARLYEFKNCQPRFILSAQLWSSLRINLKPQMEKKNRKKNNNCHGEELSNWPFVECVRFFRLYAWNVREGKNRIVVLSFTCAQSYWPNEYSLESLIQHLLSVSFCLFSSSYNYGPIILYGILCDAIRVKTCSENECPGKNGTIRARKH